MKFDCSRKDLDDALKLAYAATSQRSAFPILQSVRIEAEGSQVSILGCDAELWAERQVLANVSEPGSVCLQGKLIAELIQKLPDGVVSFELQGSSVMITEGASDWRMLALPADEFPPVPAVSGDSKLTLPMDEFRDLVGSVAFAVADDSTRPVLTGILLSYDGENLTLVATDTHRLAVRSIPKEGIGSNVSAIVPEKAVKAIRSLPIEGNDPITIQFDEARLFVESHGCRVVCQLLAGSFPNWERVVPREFTRSWTVERDHLIANVNRSMILAKDNANRVRFSGKGDQVLISTRSEDKGEAKEEIPAMTTNGELDIAFNGRYVLDAVNAFKVDGVRIELTEASRPAVFRPADDGDESYCVIMPMALG